jgi:hypothetical protein
MAGWSDHEICGNPRFSLCFGAEVGDFSDLGDRRYNW